MTLLMKPPPFIVDNNGEILEALECDCCKVVFYESSAHIYERDGLSPYNLCKDCNDNESAFLEAVTIDQILQNAEDTAICFNK